MLHAFGLLPRGGSNLLPYLMRLYEGVRDERGSDDTGPTPWKDLSDQFRWTFSRPVFPGDNERRFPVRFLGLWDTVSSVGWAWDPSRFPYTANNPSVKTVRHAVSIDERRWFFRQNLIKPADQQDVKQYWFTGVHSDVGGGYSEIFSSNPLVYSGLWRLPFEWLVAEANGMGLVVDAARLQEVLHKTPPTSSPWDDPQHESLTWGWWPAEFFPKMVWNSKLKKNQLRMGLGRHRLIDPGALIHRSVLLRIRETRYSPPNFGPTFLKKIRELVEVPEVMPFEPDV
jgi:uncharacterized protein (DUF2235 family)